MIFQKAEPDENFDVTKYSSPDGEWDIGIRRVMFGFRVCGNPIWEKWSKNNEMDNLVKCQSYSFDYCAGADFVFVMQLFATMIAIMESLPSTIKKKEVESMLPDWERRPINIEGEQCWPKLQALAAKLLAEAEAIAQAETILEQGNE